MPRYFFDIHDTGKVEKDDMGTEFATPEEACDAAMQFLPDVAREKMPKSDNQHLFAVLVTDEGGRPIYFATLSFAGLRLLP